MDDDIAVIHNDPPSLPTAFDDSIVAVQRFYFFFQGCWEAIQQASAACGGDHKTIRKIWDTFEVQQ